MPVADRTSVRVDAWTWSVRIFPTRSAAAAACKGGRVHVNGKRAKPAQSVSVGDRVEATTDAGPRIVVVERVIGKRVGAPIARECYVDHSPPPPTREERQAMPQRERGAGRPTKRDRRRMEEFKGRQSTARRRSGRGF